MSDAAETASVPAPAALPPEFFAGAQPADLATIVECVAPEDRADVFAQLPAALRAGAFAYLEWSHQTQLLGTMAARDIGALLDEVAPDDRTALLASVTADERRRLLGTLSPDQRAIAEQLLSYPEEAIGRLMTTDYLAVSGGWTVKRVLDHIREHGKDSETLNAVYVIDGRHKLVTDVRIRELLLAPLDRAIGEVTTRKPVVLGPTDRGEIAVQIFRKYDRTALPVVDASGVLIGIVTVDDVLDVAQEEATRDAQQFGGVEALDEAYMRVPVLPLVKKRAGWLIVLFLGEMLTATAMGYFEHELDKAVVLALFVPLIISSGGNSGSQAATLIIRALAVGELQIGDWWLVVRRELISGVLLGSILGVIGFVRIAAWSLFSDIYGPHWALIGATVAFSLVGIVLWGTLSGSTLPLLLKRVGLDPATSSAPFVATLVDVTGLIIYFSFALFFLRGTLL